MTTHNKRGALHRTAMSVIISFVIVFLAAANGIFTYSGAYLYLNEEVYAVLFAVAVQFTIAATLITLPFVHGFGKLSLITVYVAALILSTLSAYTYIYNSSLPGDITAYTIDTELKSRITNDLSDVVLSEEKAAKQAKTDMLNKKLLMNEEAAQGGRSNLGPGKGARYYQKEDAYQAAKTEYELLAANLTDAKKYLYQINQVLANKSTDYDRDQLLVDFSQLRANVNTEESRDIIESISKTYLGNLQNPVERAVSALIDKGGWSIQLIVSVIWAAVFDIIALFLGIIRYYLLRPEYSLLKNIYEGILEMSLFATRIFHIKDEVRMRYHKEQGIHRHDNLIPLNSIEIQTFATKLLAGSQMAANDDEDPSEPLHKLVSLIEPLNIEDNEQAVGMKFDTLDDEPRLKTLLAMLIQTRVLLKNSEHHCFILNPDDKMSQKVMIFIRMGMKDEPEDMGIVNFLMDKIEDRQETDSQPALLKSA